MAIDFTVADSDHLSVAAPVTTYPFSMGVWFKPDDADGNDVLMDIGDASSDPVFRMQLAGNAAGDFISFNCFSGGWGVASTTTGYSAATWHYAFAVAASSTDRKIYLDGGGVGSNTDDKTPTGIDTFGLAGEFNQSGPVARLDGALAHAAIWDVALTAADAVVLAAGMSPWMVSPADLVAYWPLFTADYDDMVADLTLTPNGTPSVVADPPAHFPVRTMMGVG